MDRTEVSGTYNAGSIPAGATMPTSFDWRAGSIYFALFCLLYLYHFLCLGLDLDEYMDFYGASLDTYTAQDRWGQSAYRLFFGEGTAIWAAGVASALYLSLTYVIQIQLLGLRSMMSKLLFGGLCLCCTQFAYMIGFMQHVDAIAFSLLLTTLSAYLLFTSQSALWWRFLAAMLMTAFALGCYQTSLFYLTALVCALFIQKLFAGNSLRDLAKPLIYFALLAILSVGLWYTLRLVTHPMASEQARDYATAYHSSRSQAGSFFGLDIKMKILYLAHYAKMTVITAFGSLEGGRLIYSTALLPLGYMITLSWLRLTWLPRLLSTALLLSIWLLPFVLILILGTPQPARTFLAEPLSLALLWTLAWNYAPERIKQGHVQGIAIFLLAFLFIKALYRTSEAERYQNSSAQQLVAEIRLMEAQRLILSHQEGKEISVLLVPMNEKQGFDAVISLGPVLHHHQLKAFSTLRDEDEQKHYAELLAEKPYWPELGSVLRQGDQLIIKYKRPGNRPKSQKLAL